MVNREQTELKQATELLENCQVVEGRTNFGVPTALASIANCAAMVSMTATTPPTKLHALTVSFLNNALSNTRPYWIHVEVASLCHWLNCKHAQTAICFSGLIELIQVVISTCVRIFDIKSNLYHSTSKYLEYFIQQFILLNLIFWISNVGFNLSASWFGLDFFISHLIYEPFPGCIFIKWH